MHSGRAVEVRNSTNHNGLLCSEIALPQDSLGFEMKPDYFLLPAILALISAQWSQHCAVSMIQLGVVFWFCFVIFCFLAVYSREILSLYVGMSGFPGGTVVKNPPANAGDTRDTGSIPGSGRCPGAGNSNPFWYSCLENPMDRGAWRPTVHGVAKSQIQPSTDKTHVNMSSLLNDTTVYIVNKSYLIRD